MGPSRQNVCAIFVARPLNKVDGNNWTKLYIQSNQTSPFIDRISRTATTTKKLDWSDFSVIGCLFIIHVQGGQDFIYESVQSSNLKLPNYHICVGPKRVCDKVCVSLLQQ